MAPAKPLAEKKPRYFNVEQANKTLPLVKVIVQDIVHQSRLVDTLQQRLTRVLRERRRPSEDLYSEELKQSQSELEIEEEKLQGYVNELIKLGVELKSDEIGLCDFRSLRDGREVYLCWKLGEDEVMYWHELDAGVAGRRRLRASDSGAEVAAKDDSH